MNRRDFAKLGMAALGGIVAGANIARADSSSSSGSGDKAKDPKKPIFLQEPHICRGLNTCKGKGKDKKNACAGQGSCFTTKSHTCGGKNDCRGLGGCGKNPGENECSGKGDCAVPMDKDTWAKARKTFEAQMTKAKMKFGDAPKGS